MRAPGERRVRGQADRLQGDVTHDSRISTSRSRDSRTRGSRSRSAVSSDEISLLDDSAWSGGTEAPSMLHSRSASRQLHILMLAALGLGACSEVGSTAPAVAPEGALLAKGGNGKGNGGGGSEDPGGGGFTDEFEGFSTDRWIATEHALGRGWFRPQNVSASNGLLALTSPAGTFDGGEIRSRDKFGYGRYEARIKAAATPSFSHRLLPLPGQSQVERDRRRDRQRVRHVADPGHDVGARGGDPSGGALRRRLRSGLRPVRRFPHLRDRPPPW